jgi:hypothetical protein
MKKVLALVLVLAMALSLAACGGSASSTAPAGSEAAPTGGAFKVGVSGPLTGDAAIYGQGVANGAKIAVDEINAAGGAITFEMKSEDDVADGETSVNAYNTMMDWGMQLLVGPTTSGASIAETVPIIKAQADCDIVGLMVSLDRMEVGQEGTISALQEIKRKYGFPTSAIVTMKEVTEYLYNRPVDGKVIIDDKIKGALDKYYDGYGVK